MNIDFDGIFNGTILIFWSLFFIPYALREKKYTLFGLVGALMLAAEITISMIYAHHEWPDNFIAGVTIFVLGLLFGFAIHLVELRKQKD